MFMGFTPYKSWMIYLRLWDLSLQLVDAPSNKRLLSNRRPLWQLLQDGVYNLPQNSL